MPTLAAVAAALAGMEAAGIEPAQGSYQSPLPKTRPAQERRHACHGDVSGPTTHWRSRGGLEGLAFRLAKRFRRGCHESNLGVITKRRILYWLAAMVAVLVVGTIIGLIWADTSDVAGLIAVVTNLVGAVGIVLLLIALGVVTWRQRQAA